MICPYDKKRFVYSTDYLVCDCTAVTTWIVKKLQFANRVVDDGQHQTAKYNESRTRSRGSLRLFTLAVTARSSLFMTPRAKYNG